MTSQQTFRQANAFAMLDGLKFGVYWCFGFFCVVKGICNVPLNTLGLLVTLSAPIFGCYLTHRFEKQVRPDEPVSYGKAYLYSALLYFYATVILAIAAFVYFKMLDNGQFADSYMAIYNSVETQAAIKETQMDLLIDATVKQNGFNNFEELFRSVGPMEIAMGLFNLNTLTGLILSLPTALFGRTRGGQR